MNVSGLFKQLAAASGIIGLVALLCAGFSRWTGDAETFRGLLFTGLTSVFFGLFWSILARDAKTKSGTREALLFMIVFWLLGPLLAAPAFLSSGVSSSWLGAYFEAASNLTTTGASAGESGQPDGIRLWRSGLQMIGGLYSVLMATLVLAALNSGGPGIQKTHFLTLNPSDLFEKYYRIGGGIAAIYVGLACLGALGLAMAGMTPLNAITRSVAAVTTSAPLNDANDPYSGTYLAVGVTSFLLFVGATNVALHADIFRREAIWRYFRDSETVALIIGVLLVGAGMFFLRGGFDLFLFAEALSFVSTSGMDVSGIGGVMERLPQPIPNLLAFVGGSALSTAGGYKIARVLVLFNRAGTEFKRLTYTHALAPLRYAGRSHSYNVILGVWVYLIAYVSTTALLALCLTFDGVDLSSSYSAAIGSISNVGPLIDEIVYDQTPGALTLALLSIGCILGRLEVLVVAPLFTLNFWRR